MRALCLVLLAGCGALPEGPPPPPNVVLIVTDDQGWGEVAHRGHPYLNTPHLDAMARDGLTLERFYAAAPVCSPTRASLLTGRHPTRTGTWAWGHELPGDERTVAEVLGEAGYLTGHFGKWHLGSVRLGEATSPGAQGFEAWASAPNFFDLDPWLSYVGAPHQEQGEGSDVVTDWAEQFVRVAVERQQPFLCVVWYGNPHLPHLATEADLAPHADVPEDCRAYCAELHAIDRNVGRLRGVLSELGVAEDTLVWFTSDNGPRAPGAARAHATGGLRADKGTLWEGGVRVPTWVVWPGHIEAGARSDVPAGTIDVLPTLVELAGAPGALPRPIDGTSLRPVFGGAALEPRGMGFWSPPVGGRGMHADRILETQARGERSPEETPPVFTPPVAWRDQPPGHAAWIEGRWKLHVRPEAPAVQLFDLDRDPAERLDLAGVYPERARAMRAALEAWQAEVLAEHPSRP